MRTHTDAALLPSRRLIKQYSAAGAFVGGGADQAGGAAIGSEAPNSFNTNKPMQGQALGQSGSDGVISFFHDGATQDFDLFVWHASYNKITPAQGWIYHSTVAALVAQHLGTFTKVPEQVPFYIQAKTSACTNAFITGQESGANFNTAKKP